METNTEGMVTSENTALPENVENQEEVTFDTEGDVEGNPDTDTENEENPIVEEEDSEENSEGDLEDLFDEEDLEDPNQYNIGGYDLSKYKDIINPDNDKDYQEFSDYISAMKDNGFTQKQVEFMIDKEIAEEEQTPNKPDKKAIKEKLNASLTLDEKRNYKALNNFVSGAIQGTDIENQREEIMTNPALVKLVNTIYKKTLGRTTNINRTKAPSEGRIKTMSIDSAFDVLNQAMSDGGNIDEVIKNLRKKVSDKEGFKDLLKVIGK